MVLRNVRAQEGRALLEVFDALRQGAHGTTAVTVRILAAADHDGVCASRILVALLQQAGLKYTVVPVTSNSEIVDHIRLLAEDAEVRSLVLLNCGASLDLERHLEECDAPHELTCFVIDAHRPFLLPNLSIRHQRVVVLDDDPIAEATGNRPPLDREDGGEASESEDEDKENDNDTEENLVDSGKRRRAEDRQQGRAERKRKRINEYYHTSYYATPTALSLFKLARKAAPPSQDLLWLAAVSLVGYHDQGQLGEVEYNRLNWEELKETNDRTAESFLSSENPSAGSTLPDGASDDEDPPSRRPPPRRAPEKRSLRFENELRLTLYKHWRLEDAVKHSSYFSGTLELHRDKGERALKNFFATAGIPPSDYHQMFSCMQMRSQKTIQSKFRSHGKAYGLTENKMFLEQFVRDLGPLGESFRALYLNEVSCQDAVHILCALLSSVSPELSSDHVDRLPRDAAGRLDLQAVNELERQAMVANFWHAFDAVLCKEPQAVREGIEEAIALAEAVQRQGRLIRDTKALRMAGQQFRWCRLEQPELVLRHHIAVRRLAVWLLHVICTYRPRGSSMSELPLVVVVKDKVRDTYLCVGVTPSRLSESDEWGQKFRAALRKDPHVKYRYDFFDKSCIEIAADDFDAFWDLMTSD